jgi:hypothetical protein
LLLALAAPGRLTAQTPQVDWRPTGLTDRAIIYEQAPDSGASSRQPAWRKDHHGEAR